MCWVMYSVLVFAGVQYDMQNVPLLIDVNRPKIDGSKSHENLPEKIQSARQRNKGYCSLVLISLSQSIPRFICCCIQSVRNFPAYFSCPMPTKCDAINLLSIKNSFIQNSRAHIHSELVSGNANHKHSRARHMNSLIYSNEYFFGLYLWLRERLANCSHKCFFFFFFHETSNVSHEPNARRETQSIHDRRYFRAKNNARWFQNRKLPTTNLRAINERMSMSTEWIDRHRTHHTMQSNNKRKRIIEMNFSFLSAQNGTNARSCRSSIDCSQWMRAGCRLNENVYVFSLAVEERALHENERTNNQNININWIDPKIHTQNPFKKVGTHSIQIHTFHMRDSDSDVSVFSSFFSFLLPFLRAVYRSMLPTDIFSDMLGARSLSQSLADVVYY